MEYRSGRSLMCSVARAGFYAGLLYGVGGAVIASAQEAGTEAAAAPEAPPTAEGPAAEGDIVVTAQRRNESLQKVPISITAATAEMLEKANVSSVADLGMIAPSLSFAQEGAWSQPRLRGVGTSATGPGIESAVAVYIDGVYQASMVGGAAEFNNVQAVEVINGPQGTLFGRNATGGLIQIRTLDPSYEFRGSASLGYGNYDTISGDVYLTGGLSSTVAADFSASFSHQGKGYGTNLFTGNEIDKGESLFLRSKLLFEPTDALKFTLSGNYSRVDFDAVLAPAPGSVPLGGAPVALEPRDLNGAHDPRGRLESYGGSLKASLDLRGVVIESTTAYQDTQSLTIFSGALTPNPVFESNLSIKEPHRQFSQELQFSSPSGGVFVWTAGLYYFNEVSHYSPVILSGALYAPVTVIDIRTRAETNSFAAYGQGTLEIAPDTHLTAGLRYTTEKRAIELSTQVFGPGAVDFGTVADDGSNRFNALTWRLSLDHSFAPGILGYASYNRGYKSGGFNPAIMPAKPFDPERLDAYEIGFKTQTDDRRLRFNVAAFLYDYQNIQVQNFRTGILDINNGDARFYGVEFDANAKVTDYLTLTLGATALHAKFTNYPDADFTTPVPGGGTAYGIFDAKGQRVPYAPKATLMAAANYSVPTSVGDLAFNASYNYNDGWNAEPDGRLRQKPYHIVNGSITLASSSDKWELSLWAKNILDEDYSQSLLSLAKGDTIEWAPPRTYGVKLKANF